MLTVKLLYPQALEPAEKRQLGLLIQKVNAITCMSQCVFTLLEKGPLLTFVPQLASDGRSTEHVSIDARIIALEGMDHAVKATCWAAQQHK